MLDYGYRSKCCFAPIRLASKLNKKTNIKIKIWVCTKCKSRDVDILSKDALQSQVVASPFEKEEPREMWDS